MMLLSVGLYYFVQVSTPCLFLKYCIYTYVIFYQLKSGGPFDISDSACNLPPNTASTSARVGRVFSRECY